MQRKTTGNIHGEEEFQNIHKEESKIWESREEKKSDTQEGIIASKKNIFQDMMVTGVHSKII